MTCLHRRTQDSNPIKRLPISYNISNDTSKKTLTLSLDDKLSKSKIIILKTTLHNI